MSAPRSTGGLMPPASHRSASLAAALPVATPHRRASRARLRQRLFRDRRPPSGGSRQSCRVGRQRAAGESWDTATSFGADRGSCTRTGECPQESSKGRCERSPGRESSREREERPIWRQRGQTPDCGGSLVSTSCKKSSYVTLRSASAVSHQTHQTVVG